MRTPTIAALGIAAYLVILVATIPASLVAARAGVALPGLELSEASGTLWNGAARAHLATAGGEVTLDALHWRFLPQHLASGRLAFDVSASGPGGDAHATRGQAEAPLAVAIVPWIAPWRPEGTLVFAVASASWDEREARGEGSIEWRRAAVALSEVRPLGSYRLVARAASQELQPAAESLQ